MKALSSSLIPHHYRLSSSHSKSKQLKPNPQLLVFPIRASVLPLKPIVVVGSANADIYLEIPRLPNPGETITASTGHTLAGGKGANQACCGGKLAHPTYFLGQVGVDGHGRLIEEALEEGDVMIDGMRKVDGVPTGHAVVMLMDGGENSIVVVGGANMQNWPESLGVDDIDVLRNAGIVLLQREIPDWVNIQVAETAKNAGVPVILDVGGRDEPIPNQLLKQIDILSPNETELARLTGMPTETPSEISQAVSVLHDMASPKLLLLLLLPTSS